MALPRHEQSFDAQPQLLQCGSLILYSFSGVFRHSGQSSFSALMISPQKKQRFGYKIYDICLKNSLNLLKKNHPASFL